MTWNLRCTFGIDGVENPAGLYTMTVDLFYESRQPPQDRRVETFIIPDSEADDSVAD